MVFRFKKIHVLFLLALLSGVLLLLAIRADPTRQVLSAAQTRSLPIVMYHHVLRDKSRAGKYVLPQETLREDLACLQALGYTSVTVGDVLQFVRGTGDLPEKIVMLTFDDGYQSMETYVLPLLREFRMRAVLSVDTSSEISRRTPGSVCFRMDRICAWRYFSPFRLHKITRTVISLFPFLLPFLFSSVF